MTRYSVELKTFTKLSKNSQKNYSETIIGEQDKETRKQRYVSPEERPEIIDELRLEQYDNKISKNVQQNNSENDKEIPKKDICPQKKDNKLLLIKD